MKKYLLVFLTLLSTLQAAKELDTYFQYLKLYPSVLAPLGDASKGEIEIVQDLKKIEEIEKATGRQVGIVAQDKYWIWINDPVKFPSGTYGVYGRLMWQQTLKGTTGVVVMPVLPNGRIVLNRNYRHATRSWEYELPRGATNAGENEEAAALREVKEETGMVIDKLILLGKMATDTGFTNGVIPVFMAKVVKQEEATPEESEAIAGIHSFTYEELKEGYIKGYLPFQEKGKSIQIPLRDPFLAFALFQATIQQLLGN